MPAPFEFLQALQKRGTTEEQQKAKFQDALQQRATKKTDLYTTRLESLSRSGEGLFDAIDTTAHDLQDVEQTVAAEYAARSGASGPATRDPNWKDYLVAGVNTAVGLDLMQLRDIGVAAIEQSGARTAELALTFDPEAQKLIAQRKYEEASQYVSDNYPLLGDNGDIGIFAQWGIGIARDAGALFDLSTNRRSLDDLDKRIEHFTGLLATEMLGFMLPAAAAGRFTAGELPRALPWLARHPGTLDALVSAVDGAIYGTANETLEGERDFSKVARESGLFALLNGVAGGIISKIRSQVAFKTAKDAGIDKLLAERDFYRGVEGLSDAQRAKILDPIERALHEKLTTQGALTVPEPSTLRPTPGQQTLAEIKTPTPHTLTSKEFLDLTSEQGFWKRDRYRMPAKVGLPDVVLLGGHPSAEPLIFTSKGTVWAANRSGVKLLETLPEGVGLDTIETVAAPKVEYLSEFTKAPQNFVQERVGIVGAGGGVIGVADDQTLSRLTRAFAGDNVPIVFKGEPETLARRIPSLFDRFSKGTPIAQEATKLSKNPNRVLQRFFSKSDVGDFVTSMQKAHPELTEVRTQVRPGGINPKEYTVELWKRESPVPASHLGKITIHQPTASIEVTRKELPEVVLTGETFKGEGLPPSMAPGPSKLAQMNADVPFAYRNDVSRMFSADERPFYFQQHEGKWDASLPVEPFRSAFVSRQARRVLARTETSTDATLRNEELIRTIWKSEDAPQIGRPFNATGMFFSVPRSAERGIPPEADGIVALGEPYVKTRPEAERVFIRALGRTPTLGEVQRGNVSLQRPLYVYDEEGLRHALAYIASGRKIPFDGLVVQSRDAAEVLLQSDARNMPLVISFKPATPTMAFPEPAKFGEWGVKLETQSAREYLAVTKTQLDEGIAQGLPEGELAMRKSVHEEAAKWVEQYKRKDVEDIYRKLTNPWSAEERAYQQSAPQRIMFERELFRFAQKMADVKLRLESLLGGPSAAMRRKYGALYYEMTQYYHSYLQGYQDALPIFKRLFDGPENTIPTVFDIEQFGALRINPDVIERAALGRVVGENPRTGQPFDILQLALDHGWVDRTATPKARAIAQRYDQLIEEMGDTAVKIGWLTEAQRRSRYFPMYVLDMLDQLNLQRTPGRVGARIPKNLLRAEGTSRPIDMSPSGIFHYIADFRRAVRQLEVMNRVANAFNKLPEIEAQYAKAGKRLVLDDPDDFLQPLVFNGERYRAFPTGSKNDALVPESLVDVSTRGEFLSRIFNLQIPAPEGTTVPRRMAVPERVYRELEKWAFFPGDESLKEMRWITKKWKAFVVLGGTGQFKLMQTFGDFVNSFTSRARSVLDIPRVYTRMIRNAVQKNVTFEDSLQLAMKDNIERGGTSAIMFGAELPDEAVLNVIHGADYLKKVSPQRRALNLWEELTAAQDVGPRVALHQRNLEAIEKAINEGSDFRAPLSEILKMKTFDWTQVEREFGPGYTALIKKRLKGADWNISKAELRELIPPEASWLGVNIGQVFYGGYPPKFNAYVRELAMPFVAWAHQNTAKLGRYAIHKPLDFTLKILLGMGAAVHIWNNTYFSDYEENLPLWDREETHLFVPYENEKGQVLKLQIPSSPPVDALRMVGLARLLIYLTELLKMRMKPSEAAWRIAYDISNAPTASLGRAVGPVLKLPVELYMNQNLFLHRPIVPPGLEGTTEAYKLRFRYIVENLIRPIREFSHIMEPSAEPSRLERDRYQFWRDTGGWGAVAQWIGQPEFEKMLVQTANDDYNYRFFRLRAQYAIQTIRSDAWKNAAWPERWDMIAEANRSAAVVVERELGNRLKTLGAQYEHWKALRGAQRLRGD